MRGISKIKIKVNRDFQKWLEDTYSLHYIGNDIYYQSPRPRIECNDGFSMSVQGGKHSYSLPREYGTNFTEMEIGYPSDYEELIRDYAESDDFTGTVYPYTPVSLILQVIGKHGGMKKD